MKYIFGELFIKIQMKETIQIPIFKTQATTKLESIKLLNLIDEFRKMPNLQVRYCIITKL